MKTCISCNIIKDESNFYIRKGGKSENKCKNCYCIKQYERTKLRIADNKLVAETLRKSGTGKTCKSCLLERPYTEFNFASKNPDGHAFSCKDCSRPYARKYYENNRARVLESGSSSRERGVCLKRDYLINYYLENPCVDCGTKDIRVLQSDHQRDKCHEIGRLINSGYALSVLIEELSKCETRCANCHQIRTSEQFGNWRSKYVV